MRRGAQLPVLTRVLRHLTPLLIAALVPGAAFAQDVSLAADIVVMGEQHDNPVHHANQARWVGQLKPAALVFEMLSPDLATVAGSRRGEGAEALGAALRWEARGWPDFDAYYPIFTAAPEAAIRGAEVPRDALSQAIAAGAATAFGDGSGRFGLDRVLPEDERARREDEQAEAHCGLMPEDMLGGMVEAQRLRDARLAAMALDAFDATGGPVAVITGNGHARTDRAVPAMIAAARSDVTVIAIGQGDAPAPDAPFDHWVVTPPAPDRGDPCDALR